MPGTPGSKGIPVRLAIDHQADFDVFSMCRVYQVLMV